MADATVLPKRIHLNEINHFWNETALIYAKCMNLEVQVEWASQKCYSQSGG